MTNECEDGFHLHTFIFPEWAPIFKHHCFLSMAVNIYGGSPIDPHTESSPPQPRHSVDITVTECPSIEQVGLRRISTDTEASDQSYTRDSSPEDEERAEYPDRISPLGFIASWKERVRSNSLPSTVIREGLLGGCSRHAYNERRINNISSVCHVDEGISQPSTSDRFPMKRPIALRLGTSESPKGIEAEQGRVHRLMSHPAILYTNAPSDETVQLCEEMSRFTMFQPIGSPNRRDSLSPCRSPVRSPMSSRSSSPALSNRSLSPVRPRRVRSNTICVGPQYLSPQGTHLPRDPCQPSRGSISDLSSGADGREDEEDDTYSLGPLHRPRARTCPENRAWRRRAKMKAQNRPPTPPPMCSPNLMPNFAFPGHSRAKSAEELFARTSGDTWPKSMMSYE